MRLHGAAFVLLMSIVIVGLAWIWSLVPANPTAGAPDAHGNIAAAQSR